MNIIQKWIKARKDKKFRKENNLGAPDIKIGNKFEGWACSYYFTNQICTAIENDMVYGTTTLAVFKKEYIKLI